MIDINAVNAKSMRYHILKLLHMSNSIKAPNTERCLVLGLQGIGWPATSHDVRRQLEYLKARNLVEITNQDKEIWSANILPDGVDILEGSVPFPAFLSKD